MPVIIPLRAFSLPAQPAASHTSSGTLPFLLQMSSAYVELAGISVQKLNAIVKMMIILVKILDFM